MPKAAHKVVVIGHRNPDTDSICSAIAYAELKNKTSDLVCEPRRAGKMNQETEFVLKKFGVKPPRMCTDVNPKIRDVDYREMPGIPGSTSLRKAWEIMRDKQIDTLPVTSADNELEGVITVKDIATANMDVFDTGILAKSRTSFRNILETLDGTMAVGSADDICTTGHIRIGTATPEMLESTVEKGDIVILTNRYESQLCAIEKEASLLILCNNAKVGRTIQRIAEETGVAIMTTPVDTYAAGKLISQCAPISYYMTRSDIMKFTLVTPVADVTRVMAKVRHRYFPILDEDGKYCGMVSRRNIINLRKRRIILVDHNEATQAVEGFDQAEILEIIDHHRIGSLETSGPVYFRNQPVGCTATIVTQMYDENGVTIPQKTAGLLLAAILSDTLVFRSPTCTPIDVNAANRLAKIAGVDINEFANEMFEAGEKLGFLPGDLQNKVDPYLRPLYDALYDFLGPETFKNLSERGVIEVAPLAYMRGRTLNDAYIILDEAQNCTIEQMKMFLTRFGEGSRVVVTGDITQIDLPPERKSGLVHALGVLKDVEGISQIYLTYKDVVRHEMVQRIISAYDKAYNKKN